MRDGNTGIREIEQFSCLPFLVDSARILVGEVQKVDDQKVREVRIVYTFVREIPEIAA